MSRCEKAKTGKRRLLACNSTLERHVWHEVYIDIQHTGISHAYSKAAMVHGLALHWARSAYLMLSVFLSLLCMSLPPLIGLGQVA